MSHIIHTGLSFSIPHSIEIPNETKSDTEKENIKKRTFTEMMEDSHHTFHDRCSPLSKEGLPNEPELKKFKMNHISNSESENILDPVPAKKQSRYWLKDEHIRFLQAIEYYSIADIKAISEFVGTRTPAQVRTHREKWIQKIKREKEFERRLIERQQQFEEALLKQEKQRKKIDKIIRSHPQEYMQPQAPVPRQEATLLPPMQEMLPPLQEMLRPMHQQLLPPQEMLLNIQYRQQLEEQIRMNQRLEEVKRQQNQQNLVQFPYPLQQYPQPNLYNRVTIHKIPNFSKLH